MSTDRLITEYTADTTGFRRGARLYDRTLKQQERLTNERLNRVDRRWERSTRSILNARTALAALSGTLAGTALMQLRRYGEAWRDVERRLQSIGATSQAAGQDLVDLAIRTRGSIGGTAAAVQRMAKSTGADIETTMRRVETLQKLLAAGGASSAEGASVSLQLGQALQSGVLSGDEFKSMRETAPVEFLDALAKAAGIARDDLKGFAAQQKLTTDIVLRALDDLAGTADAKFGAMALSGEEAFNVLTTGLVACAGRVDESLGATSALNSAMQFLGEYMAGAGDGARIMANAIKIAGAVALVTAGNRGVGALSRAFRDAAAARRLDVAAARDAHRASRQAVIDARSELAARSRVRRERHLAHQQRVFNDLSATRSAKRYKAATVAETQALARLKVAQARAQASTLALSEAQARLALGFRLSAAAGRVANGVMAFFGGPVGLAISAVSALVLVLESGRSAAERLDEAVSELSGTLGRLKDVNTRLASDYAALKTAQERLAQATRAGGDAAQEAARKDVAAINDRIRANEKLRHELAIQARAELNDAKAAQDKLLDRAASLARQEQRFDFMSSQEGTRLYYVDRLAHDRKLQAINRQSREQLLAYAQAQKTVGEGRIKAGEQIKDLTALQQLMIGPTGDLIIRLEQLSDRLHQLEAPAELASEALQDLSQANRKALDDFADKSLLGSLSARARAIELERRKYEELRATLVKAGAAQEQLDRLDRAHQRNLRTIEARFKKKDRSGGDDDASHTRALADARKLLLETGQKALYIEQQLNVERARLRDLLPELIEMGLSRAQAEAVLNAELDRTEEKLKNIKTASEEAAKAFAKGVLGDIRGAHDLRDALGRISDRLLDLAFDRAFDMLADQFARLAEQAGGSGGILGSILGALFGGAGGGAGGASGGAVAKAATGGLVRGPGSATSDSVPALLSNGEFVVQARAVTPRTLPMLHAINQGPIHRPTLPRFAAGGPVGNGRGGGRAGSGAPLVTVDIHNHASTARVSKQAAPDGRSFKIMIWDTVSEGILAGRFDRPNQVVYGLQHKAQGN